MSAFKMIPFLTAKGSVPGGPRAVGIPVGGPRASTSPAPARQRFASKKGYTGSRAGLGRLPNGTVARSGPGGPRRFAGSVMLPTRMQSLPSPAGARTPRRPSLFARVGARMRRAAAAIGL